MKFLPTPQQLTDAITEHVDTMQREEAAELEKLATSEPVIRLHNVAQMAINEGRPASIQWRMMLILAMRLGWIMREREGCLSELATMVEEAEIEAMYREMRGSA